MKYPLIVTAALLSCSAAFAQERTPPQAAPPPTRQAQEQAVQARRAQQGTENLSYEERQKLRAINASLREEQRAQNTKMMAIRRELEALAKAEPFDEKVIRAKALELGQAEGELALLRAKYYQQLREVLPAGAAAADSGQVRSRLDTIIRRDAPPVRTIPPRPSAAPERVPAPQAPQ